MQAVMESMPKPDSQPAPSPMAPVVNSPNPSAHGPDTAVGLPFPGKPGPTDPQGMAGPSAMGRISGVLVLHLPPVLLKPGCC